MFNSVAIMQIKRIFRSGIVNYAEKLKVPFNEIRIAISMYEAPLLDEHNEPVTDAEGNVGYSIVPLYMIYLKDKATGKPLPSNCTEEANGKIHSRVTILDLLDSPLDYGGKEALAQLFLPVVFKVLAEKSNVEMSSVVVMVQCDELENKTLSPLKPYPVLFLNLSQDRELDWGKDILSEEVMMQVNFEDQ